jgi:hypothetical protein
MKQQSAENNPPHPGSIPPREDSITTRNRSLQRKIAITLTALTALIMHHPPHLTARDAGTTPPPGFIVDGTLKTKFEHAPGSSKSRFSVRNSRIGATGNINPHTDYKLQIELSNEGKFSVLDLNGTLKPLKGLTFTLGQTGIPLFNSYIVTPGTMMFANRAFIGKYFLSTRDLGLLAKYEFLLGTTPAKLEFGTFNGNTINDPVWKKDMSYGGRITLGNMHGLRTTAKIYNYPHDETTRYLLYGADLRYEKANWKVETEIMKKKNKTVPHADLLSCYLQGACTIPVRTAMFEFIRPALRWDAIDDGKAGKNGFDVTRLTAGLSFGFGKESHTTLLRLDYECYTVNHKIDIFTPSEEMDSNKLTLELLLTF